MMTDRRQRHLPEENHKLKAASSTLLFSILKWLLSQLLVMDSLNQVQPLDREKIPQEGPDERDIQIFYEIVCIGIVESRGYTEQQRGKCGITTRP